MGVCRAYRQRGGDEEKSARAIQTRQQVERTAGEKTGAIKLRREEKITLIMLECG